MLGEQFSMRSVVLDEDRTVMIYKPNSYDQSSTTYPVMYLLDGDGHLLHTAGITEFLSRVGNMPEVLIVALPNTDRTRDLTPAHADTSGIFPTAGGADNFLAFIADELMPHVEQNYRVAPYKILVGHSFGGLFSVHALITRPDVFDAHIAISPSMWWDNKGLLPKAEAFFSDNDDVKGFMYMTLGNEGGSMLAGVWGLAGIFEEKAPESFEWHFQLMKEETHGSIPHRSTYMGLEALYDGWRIENPVQLAEEGGLEAIDAHYTGLSEKFGYEIATPEGVINQLGYFFLGQDDHEQAVAVFERNVQQYPESANVYDSLGDAYNAAKQHALAKSNYEKACSMGKATDHPNAGVYCANLERVMKEMEGM